MGLSEVQCIQINVFVVVFVLFLVQIGKSGCFFICIYCFRVNICVILFDLNVIFFFINEFIGVVNYFCLV